MSFSLIRILLIPAAALLAGAFLLLVGFVGRRTGIGHPLCRKCRFDLFGRPESSTRCPECGADLSDPRAILNGQRVSDRRQMRLGLIVLAPTILWIGIFGAAGLGQFNPNAYKPMSWLLSEAASTQSNVREPAIDEIHTRISTRHITDGDVLAIADQALAVQGDVAQAWNPQWGLFVEALHDARRLPPDRWRKYLRQSIPVALVVRPVVRRGDPTPMEIDLGGMRVGDTHRLWYSLYTQARIGQTGYSGPETRLMRTGAIGRDWDQWGVVAAHLPDAVVASMADGPQPVSAHVELSIFETRGSMDFKTDANGRPIPSGVITASATDARDLSASYRLAPADQPSAALDDTPAAETESARFAHLIHRLMVRRNVDDDGNPTVEFWVRYTLPDHDFAYSVILRDEAPGHRQWPVGDLVYHNGDGWGPGFLVAKPANFTADKVDIILRPSLSAAAATIRVKRILPLEIEFFGVPVR